jgi:hypothetical protein
MFDLPNVSSSSVVADWIELELAAGETAVSKAKVASIVESLLGCETGEPFLSDVWRCLGERQDRYAQRFFVCEGDVVSRADEQAARSEYIACLLFSLYGVSDEHRTDSKLFERMTAEAIRNYLGGKTFLFGWPVLEHIDAHIANRVRDLASQSRERFVEAPAARYKDRGVDVIAWKPFQEHKGEDHRSSQVVILAQCAAGGNWREKTTQLPYGSWTQYIHWGCDPLRAFAVPRVVAEDLWHDISREAGILFDRIRILNLLVDGIKEASLIEEIQVWVEQEMQEAKT